MLDRNWWLPIARRLYIGEYIRTSHPDDKHLRQSVIIRNTDTSYRVYCHRRNVGDTVSKTHVLPRVAPPDSELDNTPDDLVPLKDVPLDIRNHIVRYILAKGVSVDWIPTGVLSYSATRERIVFQINSGVSLGRDLTDTSECKWVSYTPDATNHTHMAVTHSTHPEGLVIVEDVLSMYKVARALDYKYQVLAALGTKLTLEQLLLASRFEEVHVMLDGDPAGVKGTGVMGRSLRGVGIDRVEVHHIRKGADPKDLHLGEIRNIIGSSNGFSAN